MPPRNVALPPVAPQSAPDAARPSSSGDLFFDPDLEARLRLYLGWCEYDLRAMRDGAASTPLVRAPFVIAQSGAKPGFRGVIWDLRRRGAGDRYSPLNTGRAASSHLDWAWLELLSYGSGGVSFQVVVPLVTVFSPHLLLPGNG